MSLYGFFKFSSLENQARFNTDAIFVGAVALIGILGLCIFGVIKLMVLVNDMKEVLRVMMAKDTDTSQEVVAGRADISVQVKGARTELGNKIDELKDAIDHPPPTNEAETKTNRGEVSLPPASPTRQRP